MILYREFLIAVDNDNTVSIIKTQIQFPKLENDQPAENLPNVVVINTSMGIKSPNVIKRNTPSGNEIEE